MTETTNEKLISVFRDAFPNKYTPVLTPFSSSCVAVFTFCQQVSLQQYEDQREAATLESLKQLIRDICLSKALSVKERRRLVKEFQKHHPVVFLQHFSSIF